MRQALALVLGVVGETLIIAAEFICPHQFDDLALDEVRDALAQPLEAVKPW